MDHKEGAYKVRDLSLADAGRMRIEWAESRMPVLAQLREEYAQTKPFEGYKITGCLHVTKETAVLVETFAACGAEVAWSGCNPLSTNDEVSAALAQAGIEIYAWYGQNVDDFYWCIERSIDKPPHLTLDDGADLIFTVHKKFPHLADHIIGGSEETTTGVHRLRAMADDGKLLYPVYAVNDAETKWDFDNVYGTGQSTLDGILRASSVLIAGKNFVVAGYGHCGRGVAMRAKGLGANVIVTEVKATAALKATLEGMRVMTMEEAAKVGDIFVTATGMKDIIRGKHFVSMKEGAIVCNTGHYDVELNLKELAENSKDTRVIRDDNREYTLDNGKKVFVLAEGRLVNLAAAEGHPSEVMDMSFANQFMAHLNLVQAHKRGETLANTVIDLPVELDQHIAGIKLETMGLSIDAPSFIIRGKHFVSMKEGAIVCNTGHYDVELNLKELAENSKDTRVIRDDNREYTLDNGKKVFVLAEGRLVNLAAAEGHPSEVMDMSFANQFMAHLNLVQAHKRGETLANTVIDLPVELDQHIAGIKLETMGLSIDALTEEQVAYATDYSAGT